MAKNNSWELIGPALHIASMLIIDKPALAFFRCVKYGVPTRQNGHTVLAYTEPIDTSSQDSEVLHDLENLAKRIRIVFGALKPSRGDKAQTPAVFYVSHQHFGTLVFIPSHVGNFPAANDFDH
jgi:hypothetical protein